MELNFLKNTSIIGEPDISNFRANYTRMPDNLPISVLDDHIGKSLRKFP